ncbi:MAG: hypothetical protein WDW38_010819 [Sanguina aurantia]
MLCPVWDQAAVLVMLGLEIADDVRERKPYSGVPRATNGEDGTPTPVKPRSNRPARSSAPYGGSTSANEPSSGSEVVQYQGVLKELPEGVSGGMQGLSWYAARQRQDPDGDIAEEFYVESEPTRKDGPRTFKKVVSSKTKRLSVLTTDQGNVVLARA